uniref:Putative cyclopropane-fatty-acyl-phospholipid synthase n=1 Tax=uncultured marine microorganism HF4000_133G03 TaxID=455521 RepID=B3T213_9ZZZZ|nr:putative cyclopropane-fatty-acyl-phospholipid synthase [uncultured marine microorganism HF4000_133G03]
MLLAKLLSKIFSKKNGIILIDSEGQKYICGTPNLNNPLTLKLLKKELNWKLVLNPDLNFPEAYMRGEIEFENGSLLDFLNMTFENIGHGEINISGYIVKKILHAWRFITNYNLPGRSKFNAQSHYDIGGAKGESLYDLFLDKKHRQYSCAYFKKDDESLEDAQQNKLNHIIRKLDIKPGQRVLDIGCGWGGMVYEIARQSQCEVTGISLSENQINYCKKKAKEFKLDNQVNFELCDYREVKGKYQRLVSVGAFEHIGKKFYKTFFKKVHNIMTDNGICLLHTIGTVNSPGPTQPFIQKRIFPGGIVPSLSDLISPIEKTGLILADCETLIHHYDKTLKAWLDRFLKNKEKAKFLYNKEFVRMWEFYLAGCSAGFKFKDLVVYQLQLVKSFTALPSNRRNYIYQ